MNFATDLPPLISDLERVCDLPETDQLAELQQNLNHQQEVLLKVKDYLVYLYDQRDKEGGGDLVVSGGDAGAIAAAVIQELQLKKTEWVAPISQELDQLTAQKQILEREIYRLNQQYEAALGEFPQQLLSRFQGLLQTHLGKAVELFEQRLRYISSVTHPMQGLEDAGFAASEAQTDPGRSPTEHLQAVQNNLDKSVSDLDSTIHTVFTALEQDIAAYGISLTGNLRQLNGVQAVMDKADLSTSTIPRSPDPVEPKDNIPAEPDSPELDSLMNLTRDEAEDVAPDSQEPPETASLFGADSFDYQAEQAAGESNDSDNTAQTPEERGSESYLDFAASVAEEGLFGDGDDSSSSTTDNEAGSEAIAAETFLFGDAVASTDSPESQAQTPDLKSVIATPPPTTSETSGEGTEKTTVKTIQLLTDLLEDGALNVQETEAEQGEEVADVDADAEPTTTEDLNPDLDTDEGSVTPVDVTVLDPEKMNQLAEDLVQFETTTDTSESSGEAIEVDVVANETPDNPWDDNNDTSQGT
ncbi:hypothetical protein Lepto7376_4309 [[Leptolyngbya] sp. PCC 7376]|uniref:hypothetical protein n=1 Tax=[Leptolyngbya] sp. PCC 7376 TaxID=111781 RepID=UPI00029F3CEE|nr:hypothetical protein [[Leptolyngbya] sp. PCC 7376]AFY40418.1 hypothetical protein Lepto7376_4309 [[Leptolyngbya] sp. PCC 7376]